MSKQKEAIILKSSFEETEEKKDPYIGMLRELNINCHSIKSIDFEFCNIQSLKEKLLNPEEYQGLILSSPRCVTALEKCDLELCEWRHKRTFVVGEKTAECAKSQLKLEPEGQTSGNSANLAAYIISQGVEGRLLLPVGDLSRDTLSSALSKAKIRVERLTVYRTTPHPRLEASLREVLDEHKISFIVSFSPSSVAAVLPFLRRYPINLASVEWIAIGPTTESCLLENQLRIGCVAEKPTPESLAKAMKEFLG